MNYKDDRKKLIKMYHDNIKQIKDYEERRNFLHKSTIECEFGSTMIFAFPAYIAMVLLTGTVLATSIPIGLVPLISIGGSLVIGNLCVGVLDKISGTDKEIKAITRNKTQKEILKEKMECSIEINQYKARNRIIKGIINKIDHEKEMIEGLSNKYNIVAKNDDRSKDEIKKDIHSLEDTLDSKYNELDATTTKQTLQKKFWKYRGNDKGKIIKMEIVISSIIWPLVGGTIPIALFNSLSATLASFDGVMSLFAPAIIGAVAASTIGVKYQDDKLKVFNELNDSLGDNRLDSVSDNGVLEDSFKLSKEVEKCEEKIVDLECKFYNEKCIYDSLGDLTSECSSKDEFGSTVIDLSYLDEMSKENTSTKKENSKVKQKSKTNK